MDGVGSIVVVNGRMLGNYILGKDDGRLFGKFYVGCFYEFLFVWVL